MDFQSLLPELTLEEKVSLLSGRDFHAAAGIDRLGIPPMKVSKSLKSHDCVMTRQGHMLMRPLR